MAKAPRSDDVLYLVRLDGQKVTGWQYRQPGWHPDGPRSQYFADNRYGGSAEAFAAARAMRDEAFKKFNLPLRPGGRGTSGSRNKSNVSGLIGVSFQTDVREGYRDTHYWVAFWSQARLGQMKRRFSVSYWGYEGAFWQAVELRQRKTKMLFTNEEINKALRENRARATGH